MPKASELLFNVQIFCQLRYIERPVAPYRNPQKQTTIVFVAFLGIVTVTLALGFESALIVPLAPTFFELLGSEHCKRAARDCLRPSTLQLAGLHIYRQRLTNGHLTESWRDVWQKLRIVYNGVWSSRALNLRRALL
jgi:hypothetical protein